MDPRSIRMYGVMIQMINVYLCIAPENDTEIGSGHVVGKNRVLLILDSCKKKIKGKVVPVLS
jgi:hypothetical protein